MFHISTPRTWPLPSRVPFRVTFRVPLTGRVLDLKIPLAAVPHSSPHRRITLPSVLIVGRADADRYYDSMLWWDFVVQL